MSPRKPVAQAFVELRSTDPEAASAQEVAQATLEAGRDLVGLRRLRVFELAGTLPERAELEALLHRSTQFYNPAKERCALRLRREDPAPLAPDERAVAVFDRDGERRPAAERWWRHETGSRIEIREGVAWVMRFAPGADADACAASLAETVDRRHGLFCNPHFQEWRAAPPGDPPIPWMSGPRKARDGARRPRAGGGS